MPPNITGGFEHNTLAKHKVSYKRLPSFLSYKNFANCYLASVWLFLVQEVLGEFLCYLEDVSPDVRADADCE